MPPTGTLLSPTGLRDIVACKTTLRAGYGVTKISLPAYRFREFEDRIRAIEEGAAP